MIKKDTSQARIAHRAEVRALHAGGQGLPAQLAPLSSARSDPSIAWQHARSSP